MMSSYPERYELPLRSMERLKPYQPEHYPVLMHRVIQACEQARRYSKDNDPNEQARRRDNDALKQIEAQISAIRRLQQFMRQHPFYAGYALGEVHLHHLHDAINPGSATVGSKISLEQKKDLPDLWIDMLETYADSLQTRLMAKRGPWIHRFTVGPLRYQRPIDKQTSRVDAAVTGLLFQLVMYFRRFTSGGRLRFMQGESMPDYGEPCYDLAAEFVQAATGEEMGSASQVGYRLEKLLRANPGIGFAGWPS